MNKLNYYLLNITNKKEPLNEKEYKKIWIRYEGWCLALNCKLNITEEEFKTIIETIYDVTSLVVNEDYFKTIIERYLKLLLSDANDKVDVDVNWCINHLWYLEAGLPVNEVNKKCSDCLNLIQELLLKKLNINEKLTTKFVRRLTTHYFAK